jgi:hypothetical protein
MHPRACARGAVRGHGRARNLGALTQKLHALGIEVVTRKPAQIADEVAVDVIRMILVLDE